MNGWRSRSIALNRLLEKVGAHVAVLHETKLTEAAKPPTPKGWSLIRQDRRIHRVDANRAAPAQGGVAILVKQGLKHEPLTSPLPANCTVELIGTRIRNEKSTTDIWALYRPPYVVVTQTLEMPPPSSINGLLDLTLWCVPMSVPTIGPGTPNTKRIPQDEI